MITFAPVLDLSLLIKSIFIKQPNEKQIANPWCSEDDSFLWFSRTAWSLHTIIRWWQINFSKNPIVWIPGYFCDQSLWPLRQTDAEIIFYPLQEQMLPNWEICESLAKTKKPDIFIITHFYGFITPTENVNEFCGKYNSLIIEDAAHILVPTGDVGKKAHFVLYSPHKFFSLDHGALCVLKSTIKDYIRKNLNSNELITFQNFFLQMGKKNPPILKWFLIKIIKGIIKNNLNFLNKRVPFAAVETASPMPYTPHMHPMMKKLLSLMISKIPESIQHRKKCVFVWEKIFSENNIKVQRLTFNQQVIPYLGVFKSINNEAEIIYTTYNKWPLSTWPDLPPEVRADPILHKTTIAFRNNVLVVPVHQTLSFSELEKEFGKKSN